MVYPRVLLHLHHSEHDNKMNPPLLLSEDPESGWCGWYILECHQAELPPGPGNPGPDIPRTGDFNLDDKEIDTTAMMKMFHLESLSCFETGNIGTLALIPW